jgi:hypothetical protein
MFLIEEGKRQADEGFMPASRAVVMQNIGRFA